MSQTYFRLLLACACGHLEKVITRNEDNPVNFVLLTSLPWQCEFNMDKNRAPQCRGQGDQKDG